jgi:hypothetical protein
MRRGGRDALVPLVVSMREAAVTTMPSEIR